MADTYSAKALYNGVISVPTDPGILFRKVELPDDHTKDTKLPSKDGDLYYNGASQNKKANGKGVLSLKDDNRYYEYDGMWTEGLPFGDGAFTLKEDGKVILQLIGKWSKLGKITNGKMIFADGEFEGTYVDKLAQGEGKMTINKKLKYQGSFSNGRKDGPGTEYTDTGSIAFKGNWSSGSKGKGFNKETYPDGSSFEGLFLNGKRNGCGVFTWPSGLVEEREYDQGHLVRAVKMSSSDQFKDVEKQLYEKDNELDEIKRKTICQMCLKSPRDALATPCMHFLYCQGCLGSKKTCPACNAAVTSVLKCKLDK